MDGIVLTKDVIGAFGKSVPDIVDELQSYGYSGIEVQGPQKRPDTEEVVRRARRNGMVVTFDTDFYSADTTEQTLSELRKQLEKGVEMCESYGAHLITVNAQILEKDVASDLDKCKAHYTDSDVREAFKRMIRTFSAEKRKHIALENSSFYPTGPRYPHEMIDMATDLGCKVNFDMAHAVVNGISIDAYLEAREVIGKVHVSDNIYNMQSREQLERKYSVENVERFVKAQNLQKHTIPQILKRDWHLPAGTGTIPKEDYDKVAQLAPSVPILHELKSIGLELLGKSMKEVVTSPRQGLVYSI